MTKMTTPQYALTHAKAHIFEIIQYEKRAMDYMHQDYVTECKVHFSGPTIDIEGLDIADFVDGYIRDAKTFVEVKNILKKIFKDHYIIYLLPRVELFYNAMKKVIPAIEYKDHAGTEDRGWWRVFDEITGTESYFCSGDLGRDAWMALQFYKQGAITQLEYNNHITQRTLRILNCKSFFNHIGQPDYGKIIGYWKPEFVEKELDMRFVNVLKEVQSHWLAEA
jgi:hypothetical protein